MGDSFEDKVTMPSSVFRYWVGSSSMGGMSSMGLSGSSTGCSVSCSIEEYC